MVAAEGKRGLLCRFFIEGLTGLKFFCRGFIHFRAFCGLVSGRDPVVVIGAGFCLGVKHAGIAGGHVDGHALVVAGGAFQPISSAKSYDAYMAANRAKQAHDEKKNDLVLLALKSRDTGSAEGRKEMLRELKAWNDRMDKENRPSMKITFKSVMQTVAARRAENKPTKKNLQKKAEQQAAWR